MHTILSQLKRFTQRTLPAIMAICLIFLSVQTLAPVTTYAQDLGLESFKILGYDCIIKVNRCESGLLEGIISFLLSLAPILAVLVLMWGGYQYFSGKPKEGQATIQAAVIGFIIVILADFIINTVVRGSFTPQGEFTVNAIRDFLFDIRDNFLIPLASIAAIIVIIIGGYQYLFSGLPGAKENGKQTITNGVIGLIVILLAIPLVNALDTIFSTNQGRLQIQTGDIVAFIMQIINGLLIPIVSVVTAFLFILGGYQYLTARDDSGQTKKAIQTIQNATIGLVIVLFSFTLVQITILIANSLS